MKKLILILSIISSPILGCSKDGSSNKQDKILGTWKHIERYSSDGATGDWYPIDNNILYTFENDGILSVNGDFQCFGNYNIEANILSIDIDCGENQWQLLWGTTFDIKFESDLLTLVPNPMECDEGCADKLQKIE